MKAIHLSYENGNSGYVDDSGELDSDRVGAMRFSDTKAIEAIWATIIVEGLQRMKIVEVPECCEFCGEESTDYRDAEDVAGFEDLDPQTKVYLCDECLEDVDETLDD